VLEPGSQVQNAIYLAGGAEWPVSPEDWEAAARAALERAVELAPREPEAWNTLGVARYRTSGPRPAMEAWQRALALDPRRLDVLFNLGLVATEAGDRQVARQALERFVEQAPPERFAADIARARAALRRLAG